MLKIIKLTCLVSLFFAGGFESQLYAQTAKDSTAIVPQKKAQGILVKGVVKSAKNNTALKGNNTVIKAAKSQAC